MSEQFEWHWQTRIKELEARIEALEAALREAAAALEKAAQKRTTGPNPDPQPDKYGIGRRGG